MTQKDLFPTAIFSQQATPVSPSLSPGSKKAQKMTATSGRTYLELLHKKDPLGAFSKMFMVTSPWASTRCCLTWKAKATPQGRLLFQLAASTLPTEEIDYGSSPELWATPNTMDHLPPRSEESTKKMQEGHRKGRKLPSNLREQVDQDTMKLYQDQTMWPTPTAMTGGTGVAPSHKDGTHGWNIGAAVNDSLSENPNRLWPTPLARDYKGGRKAETLAAAGRNETNSLPDAVNSQMGKTGSLNPTWVEWLMGYPEGWTDLKD